MGETKDRETIKNIFCHLVLLLKGLTKQCTEASTQQPNLVVFQMYEYTMNELVNKIP